MKRKRLITLTESKIRNIVKRCINEAMESADELAELRDGYDYVLFDEIPTHYQVVKFETGPHVYTSFVVDSDDEIETIEKVVAFAQKNNIKNIFTTYEEAEPIIREIMDKEGLDYDDAADESDFLYVDPTEFGGKFACFVTTHKIKFVRN